MTQYILINRVNVQNANAIAGLTWGYPSITNFLGFTHSLSRKLSKSKFEGIDLSGCGVVAHDHNIHTYGNWNDKFLQHKTPPYLQSHNKTTQPGIIEEGRINITVSLIIGFDGSLGNQTDNFKDWLMKQCLLQRLAGGTILKIASINIFDIQDKNKFYLLKHKLLPGFALVDRSNDLIEHYENKLIENPDTELLDAWLDFFSLKQKARPKSDLITKHLTRKLKTEDIEEQLLKDWNKHLDIIPYKENVPNSVSTYFDTLEQSKQNKAVLAQWHNYMNPTDKTLADWEYLPKPHTGYLIPIMIGYKAISPVYENKNIANTRDSHTPICFVEATHSIGEWRGINHFRTSDDIENLLWYYDYREHW